MYTRKKKARVAKWRIACVDRRSNTISMMEISVSVFLFLVLLVLFVFFLGAAVHHWYSTKKSNILAVGD